MSATEIVSLVWGIGVLLGNFAYLVKMHIRVGDYEKWREGVDRHINDRDVHIDPRRDTERWAELTKRLDKMDKKLDSVLTLEKGHIRKSQGDSDDYA